MKKTKKIVEMVLIVLVIAFMMGALINLGKLRKDNDKFRDEFTITYRAVINGEERELNESLYKSDGAYPTTYKVSESTTISELHEYVSVTETLDLEFNGWYLDVACTQPFAGVVEEGAQGDLVIYAAVTEVHWTHLY